MGRSWVIFLILSYSLVSPTLVHVIWFRHYAELFYHQKLVGMNECSPLPEYGHSQDVLRYRKEAKAQEFIGSFGRPMNNVFIHLHLSIYF